MSTQCKNRFKFVPPLKKCRKVPGNANISIATLFDPSDTYHLQSQFRIDDQSVFTKSQTIVHDHNFSYVLKPDSSEDSYTTKPPFFRLNRGPAGAGGSITQDAFDRLHARYQSCSKEKSRVIGNESLLIREVCASSVNCGSAVTTFRSVINENCGKMTENDCRVNENQSRIIDKEGRVNEKDGQTTDKGVGKSEKAVGVYESRGVLTDISTGVNEDRGDKNRSTSNRNGPGMDKALVTSSVPTYRDIVKEKWKETTVVKIEPYVPYQRIRINYLEDHRLTVRNEKNMRYKRLWKKALRWLKADRHKRRVRVREICRGAARHLLEWYHSEQFDQNKSQYDELCSEFTRVLHTEWGDEQLKKRDVAELLQKVAEQHSDNRVNKWKKLMEESREAELQEKRQREIDEAKGCLVQWAKTDETTGEGGSSPKTIQGAAKSVVKLNRLQRLVTKKS